MGCARPPPRLPPSACNPSAPFPAGFAYRPRPCPSVGPRSGSVCVLPPERHSAGWGGSLWGPNAQEPSLLSPTFSPALASLASRGRPGPSRGVPGLLRASPLKQAVKNPPGNAGDAREVDPIPRWGRPRGGGILGQRSLRAAVRGVAKSRTERAYTHTHRQLDTRTHTHTSD